VRAYNAAGQTSGEVFQSAYFGSLLDADSDGMPDAWEALFGVTDPAQDDDQDGLTNLLEFQNGTFPNQPDSDRDGYYDGQEVEQGSNPCGAGAPPVEPETKLVVVGSSELVFHNPTNLPPVDFDFLTILNLGAGTMNWQVRVSQPWILVSQLSGQDDQPLLVKADPSGLAVGNYQGSITILLSRAAQTNHPLAADTLQQTLTIPVTLVVLPEKHLDLYLPVIGR
jgi:Bacterial TSP3 repeat